MSPGLHDSEHGDASVGALLANVVFTLLSQFPGVFRREFCLLLLRFSDRRGSPPPFLCELRPCLVFGHSRKSSKPRSPSLYAQGAEIRTARRAHEYVSSWDTNNRHRFCSKLAHLLVASAEAPARKGRRGRVPSSTQRPSADDALGWQRRTRYDLLCLN